MSGAMSARVASALALLLIRAGDVELNPGPGKELDFEDFGNFVWSLAEIFKGYPCVTVEDLSELAVGDWLVYRTKIGWYAHMYVTNVDEGKVTVAGMFPKQGKEVDCDFFSVKLVVREIILNHANFEMKRLAKMRQGSCNVELEKSRMREFMHDFKHYSLRRCNSEHFLTFVKRGKKESSQIKTLLAHVAKQLGKEGIRLGSKAMLKLACDMLTCSAKKMATDSIKPMLKEAVKSASREGVFKNARPVLEEAVKNASREGLFKNALKVGAAVEGVVCAVDIGLSVAQWYDGKMCLHQLRCHTVRRVSSSAGSVLAGAGGTSIGTWLGGLIGSVFCPGAGTVVGAAVGGFVGSMIGGVAGSLAGTYAGECVNGALDFAGECVKEYLDEKKTQ